MKGSASCLERTLLGAHGTLCETEVLIPQTRMGKGVGEKFADCGHPTHLRNGWRLRLQITHAYRGLEVLTRKTAKVGQRGNGRSHVTHF